MKKIICSTAMIFFLALAAAAFGENRAIQDRPRELLANEITNEWPQWSEQERQQAQFEPDLILSDQFIGNTVRDQEGNALGRVSQVIFDTQSGQIRYLVVAKQEIGVPEFQAVEKGEYLIPWPAVSADPERRAVTVDVAAAQFEKAPKGTAVTSEEEAKRIHSFYGVAPYWEEETPAGRPLDQ